MRPLHYSACHLAFCRQWLLSALHILGPKSLGRVLCTCIVCLSFAALNTGLSDCPMTIPKPNDIFIEPKHVCLVLANYKHYGPTNTFQPLS